MEIKRLLFNRYRCNCYNVQVVLRFNYRHPYVTILNIFTVYVAMLLASALCPQLKQILVQ